MPDLAAPPADLSAPMCNPELGRMYFVSSLRIVPTGEGFDLTGDGVIDNRMGVAAAFANNNLAESIRTGTTTLMLGLRDLEGPPLVEGDKPLVSLYLGLDADVPADPSNNAMNGKFKLPIEQFDVNCVSTTTFDSSVVENATIKSKTKQIGIVAGSIGTIRLADGVQVMTPGPDLTTWTGITGGIYLACSLSITPFPGPNPASFLDVAVNGLGLTPDIDRDGDGLEKIIGTDDAITIKECVDGDGTVITGANCPCDPRIADGFSGALGFTLVPAQVVGLVTSQ
jgi:hypothetical protein